MILHRFCSKEEYEKYLAGEKLTNSKDHGADRGYDASTAVGFCFFVEDPEKAKHWLNGIVDFDYCLTFEVPKSRVSICHGRYPNWVKPGVMDGWLIRPEFCCMEYDNKAFKLIGVSDRFRDYGPNARDINKLMAEFNKKKITIKIQNK